MTLKFLSGYRVIIPLVVLVVMAIVVIFLAKPSNGSKSQSPTVSTPAASVQPINLGDYKGPPGQLAEVPAITIAGGKTAQSPSTYLVTPGTVLRLPIKSDADGQLAFVTGTTTAAGKPIHAGDNLLDIRFGGDKTYTVVFTSGQAIQLTLGTIVPKLSP